MKAIILFFTIGLGLISILSFRSTPQLVEKRKEKPKISFTFDDGDASDKPNYPLKKWNQLLLDHLEKHQLKAILFATGSRLNSKKGQHILSSWNNARHGIANQTYSHPYFNSKKVTLKEFENDFLRNDSLINTYSNHLNYFRFPYLKEGNTIEKRDGFRKFLIEQNHLNGHVTIDASDWYIDSRMLKKMKQDPTIDLSKFKDFYIKHIYDRACYYDQLAFQLTGRRIKHSLLLHHNLTSALFLEDLILHFKKMGWETINAEEAYKDVIYKQVPTNIPAGESLIWALCKQTGKYDKLLMYPAESGEYEKVKMDL